MAPTNKRYNTKSEQLKPQPTGLWLKTKTFIIRWERKLNLITVGEKENKSRVIRKHNRVSGESSRDGARVS